MLGSPPARRKHDDDLSDSRLCWDYLQREIQTSLRLRPQKIVIPCYAM
jgi:hypothetical protein